MYLRTCGALLVELLEAYGLDTIFGIPGTHALELYRGLPESKLRHVSARHEQGAGFMADGYARASGQPAACFTITGPGTTNIATAMGQAYADSVPMLVISSVNERRHLGMGTGRLHELPSQQGLTAGVTGFAHTLMDPRELPLVLARAFAIFQSRRPRPVHISIPIDVLARSADGIEPRRGAVPSRPAPNPEAIAQAAALLQAASSPIVILGGGSVGAAEEARTLVETLDVPVAITIQAKGVIPGGHPLLLGANMGHAPVREAIEAADVVLAVGTELSEVDRFPDTRDLRLKGKLIRIDLDAEQTATAYLADLAIVSDARPAFHALREALGGKATWPRSDSPGALRAAVLRRATHRQWTPEIQTHSRLLEAMQAALPGLILIGDSTQPAYSAHYCYDPPAPRSFWTSATGFGTLGYALPAAIGAKLAAPERPVVALIGDGGLQFTLPELATAVETGMPVIILLWNNRGYEEIRRQMVAAGMPPIGIDLFTPDFLAVARGYGLTAARASDLSHLKVLLQAANESSAPALIEIDEANWPYEG